MADALASWSDVDSPTGRRRSGSSVSSLGAATSLALRRQRTQEQEYDAKHNQEHNTAPLNMPTSSPPAQLTSSGRALRRGPGAAAAPPPLEPPSSTSKGGQTAPSTSTTSSLAAALLQAPGAAAGTSADRARSTSPTRAAVTRAMTARRAVVALSGGALTPDTQSPAHRSPALAALAKRREACAHVASYAALDASARRGSSYMRLQGRISMLRSAARFVGRLQANRAAGPSPPGLAPRQRKSKGGGPEGPLQLPGTNTVQHVFHHTSSVTNTALPSSSSSLVAPRSKPPSPLAEHRSPPGPPLLVHREPTGPPGGHPRVTSRSRSRGRPDSRASSSMHQAAAPRVQSALASSAEGGSGAPPVGASAPPFTSLEEHSSNAAGAGASGAAPMPGPTAAVSPRRRRRSTAEGSTPPTPGSSALGALRARRATVQGVGTAPPSTRLRRSSQVEGGPTPPSELTKGVQGGFSTPPSATPVGEHKGPFVISTSSSRSEDRALQGVHGSPSPSELSPPRLPPLDQGRVSSDSSDSTSTMSSGSGSNSDREGSGISSGEEHMSKAAGGDAPLRQGQGASGAAGGDTSLCAGHLLSWSNAPEVAGTSAPNSQARTASYTGGVGRRSVPPGASWDPPADQQLPATQLLQQQRAAVEAAKYKGDGTHVFHAAPVRRTHSTSPPAPHSMAAGQDDRVQHPRDLLDLAFRPTAAVGGGSSGGRAHSLAGSHLSWSDDGEQSWQGLQEETECSEFKEAQMEHHHGGEREPGVWHRGRFTSLESLWGSLNGAVPVGWRDTWAQAPAPAKPFVYVRQRVPVLLAPSKPPGVFGGGASEDGDGHSVGVASIASTVSARHEWMDQHRRLPVQALPHWGALDKALGGVSRDLILAHLQQIASPGAGSDASVPFPTSDASLSFPPTAPAREDSAPQAAPRAPPSPRPEHVHTGVKAISLSGVSLDLSPVAIQAFKQAAAGRQDALRRALPLLPGGVRLVEGGVYLVPNHPPVEAVPDTSASQLQGPAAPRLASA